MLNADTQNVDHDVVKHFGHDWSKFNQKNIKVSTKKPYWCAVGFKR